MFSCKSLKPFSPSYKITKLYSNIHVLTHNTCQHTNIHVYKYRQSMLAYTICVSTSLSVYNYHSAYIHSLPHLIGYCMWCLSSLESQCNLSWTGTQGVFFFIEYMHEVEYSRGNLSIDFLEPQYTMVHIM